LQTGAAGAVFSYTVGEFRPGGETSWGRTVHAGGELTKGQNVQLPGAEAAGRMVDVKAPFIATQLNSTRCRVELRRRGVQSDTTQLPVVNLSVRRRRVGGSERRDPVEVVCGS